MNKCVPILLATCVATGLLITLGIAFRPATLQAAASAVGPVTILHPRTAYARPQPQGTPQDLPPEEVHPVDTTLYFSNVEVISSVAHAATPFDLARALAHAIDIADSDIITAAFLCDPANGGCTNPAAAAVLGMAPGTWYPTQGTSFALLSTGLATDVVDSEMVSLLATPESGEIESLDSISQLLALNLPHHLNGLHNGASGGRTDLVRWHLKLRVPEDAHCLSIDFTFYTVDVLPRGNWCANSIGDLFTLQYNNDHLQIERGSFSTTVTAPGNFATYRENWIAVANMAPMETAQALNSPVGTTIPGVFPILQAKHPVSGGDEIDLYFSIQDLDDNFGNSAVALDNFTWITKTTSLPQDECVTGVSGDTDGDGLPDGWERHGKYTWNYAGVPTHVNLARLGADPNVKDIFVEIDSMGPLTSTEPVTFTNGTTGYIQIDPRPITQAISYVVDAFANAPLDPIVGSGDDGTPAIRLHVDYGPDAPLVWGDGTYWGDLLKDSDPDLSPGGTFQNPELTRPYLCITECVNDLEQVWLEVKKIKDDKQQFAPERAPIFHYGIFAHMLSECTEALAHAITEDCWSFPKISGASNHITDMVNGGSDFVVTLGHSQWWKDDRDFTIQQAGTFMHELGHNLGLNHYGTIEAEDKERVGYKPNHLSVMNYLYQIRGLVVTDTHKKVDYSRYDFTQFSLNEKNLDERVGIRIQEFAQTHNMEVPGMGVWHYCLSKDKLGFIIAPDSTHVDWNCNGVPNESGYQYNITGDIIKSKSQFSDKLDPGNEWERLTFTGGKLNRQRSMLNKTLRYQRPPLACIPPDMPIAQNVPPEVSGVLDVQEGGWNSPLNPNFNLFIWNLLQQDQVDGPPQDVYLPSNDFIFEIIPEILDQFIFEATAAN